MAEKSPNVAEADTDDFDRYRETVVSSRYVTFGESVAREGNKNSGNEDEVDAVRLIAPLPALIHCSAVPRGDQLLAWAGQRPRLRASRVAVCMPRDRSSI